LLEGKTVNLRVVERDDIDFRVERRNDMDFWGEYVHIVEQYSKSEWIKRFDNPSSLEILTEKKDFIIQKKDGTRIGVINHWINQPNRMMEISYAIIPTERRKGYGTEAVQLVVDYLFLSKDLMRIQAMTDVRNKASQRVLEKAGFRNEGIIRKSYFVRGEWRDDYLYSILREEWKEPKILTRMT
jgi:ribosomal-protein-alanine N-acetyltransferase